MITAAASDRTAPSDPGVDTSPGERSERRGWQVTFAAATGLVLGPSTILLFLFGVFVAPLQREFGWSRPAILSAVTIVSLLIMVASPIQGFLVDRFGTRRVVLWSCVPFGAGLAAVSLIGADIRGLYFAYAVLPLLAIGLWPVSYLRAVSTWFDRRLGLATGLANGGIGVGAALLPVLATYLMTVGSWRSVFVVLGLLVICVTLPINLWLLRERSARPSVQGARADGPAFRAVLWSKEFRILLVAFLLLGFVNTGLVTNQISMLTDGGITPARAALVQSGFGIAVLIGRFLTGVVLDYVPAKHLMSAVCAGGVVACLTYTTGPTFSTALGCAVLIGAVYGAEFDVLSFVVKKSFGIATFGRTYGVVFATFQFGAALGATVLPLSKAHLGSYGPGLMLYAGVLLGCALLFAVLPTRQLPPEEGQGENVAGA